MAEKFVIELEENPFIQNDDMDNPVSSSTLRRVKGFNSLVFDEAGLSKLIRLDDTVKEVAELSYKRGYDDGQNNIENNNMSVNSYMAGVKDMWEIVRRIILPKDAGCENSLVSHARELFGKDVPGWQIRRIFIDYNPEDVLSIVNNFDGKTKEEKPEVRVGDQVDLGNGKLGIVFAIDGEDAKGYFYPEDATQPVPFCLRRDKLRLTGKHIDAIEELLSNMK